MNSSRANVAQDNVRKSLRIRRACVVPKKAMNFRAKEGKIKKAKSIVRSPTKASEFASVATIVGNENDHHLAKSSIGLKKRPVGLKLNNNLIGADQSGETVEGTESVAPAISHSNQEFKKVQLENLGSGDSDLCEILSTVTNEEDNVDRSETLDSSSEIDGSVEVNSDEDDKISEHSDIDCVESVLKGLNKDIGQLYSKSDKIEKDVKELKKLLLARQSRTCIRAVSSRLKLQLAFHLLPKFPLQKKSLVRKVDREFEGEDDENDNEEYKEQLVSEFFVQFNLTLSRFCFTNCLVANMKYELSYF